MNKQEKAFEKRMERLEEIVRSLETKPPSLSDSISLYQEGKTIVKECRKELEEAEQIIEKIGA